MNRLFCLFLMVFGFSSVVFAQNSSQSLEGIFFNKKYAALEQGIRESARKQAFYAYNVANLATPGFKPILTAEDQALLNQLVPSQEYTPQILLEFMMSRMTENSKRYNAYIAMWKGKVDSLKRVISLGK